MRPIARISLPSRFARLGAVLAALALCAACALAACGGSTPPAESQPEAPMPEDPEAEAPEQPEEPELAPHPFTAAQIQAASAPGRTYRFRVRQGADEIFIRMVFTATTETAATIETTVTDAQGQIIEQNTEESSWDELVAHASYPADITEISETTIEVEAGSFDVVLYTVTTEQEGKPVTARMYFAKDMPGAPVKREVTVEGEAVFDMELLEHVAGP
ncbi:hypothetical protein [Haliangium ochraceum]|uniref:Lipoprotein n=1 Tax=Haliangium ochraceum (strain DSM 14365 / JCM 11303 / SMP-2) TaxID=502025 RepID=D0LH33_HALO1|nr:hypothetical protein [Haliangium ochraceum]ACY18178.1 hypothetical protein Hoch_5701 [Haliangium ochraceum DSM 14365]